MRVLEKHNHQNSQFLESINAAVKVKVEPTPDGLIPPVIWLKNWVGRQVTKTVSVSLKKDQLINLLY